MASSDPAQVGQALDEDDDFVEFEVDNWERNAANFNTKDLWDADWFDKEDAQDAVAQHIRTELARKAQQQQGQGQAAPQQQQQKPRS
jgi:hypothetical protein